MRTFALSNAFKKVGSFELFAKVFIAEYASLAGRPPACLAFGGGDLTQRAAEWELGDGLMFAVAFAPTSRLADGTSRPSRHTLAVRRRSLGERSQVVDAARDTTDDHLTWRPADCDAG